MTSISSRFFIRNFLLLMFTLIIPLCILGMTSSLITKQFVEDEINKNNQNILKLTKDNLELIFNELDSLNLNFGNNPDITLKLKKILSRSADVTTFEEYGVLTTIKNFIDAPANARPYIHSIYVYLNNPNRRFLTTGDGVVDSRYYDTSWYQSYTKMGTTKLIWTEPRSVQRYNFENRPNKVLTIYRRLYIAENKNAGVIVLNIYADYIERLLKSLATFPNQSIVILDENNQPIVETGPRDYLTKGQLVRVIRQNRPSVAYPSRHGQLMIARFDSDRYHWKYISIVPQRTLYNVPNKLRSLTLGLLLFSAVLGLGFTYWLTRSNYRRIQNIISIFDSVEKGSPLPPFPEQTNDEYDYITYNILKKFVVENYLQLQLSERKYKIQAIELLALQSQINPHFLFNTLETIKWKIIELTKEPNETSKMLENISDILKYSLDSPKRLVSLAEEINSTRSYVQIQKVRYRDKFELYWEYDQPVLELPVIRLLFQPLIENSIYHGIKEKPGKSYIKIKIYRKDNFLYIALIDNGMGMTSEQLTQVRAELAEIPEDSRHIGLLNTKKRLQLTFGDTTVFKVNSKHGLGTAIRIKLPLKS